MTATVTPLRRAALDDGALVDRVAAGDHDAFVCLHDRYERQLKQAAYRTLRSHQLAEEVVQEVLLDLWRRPSRFEASRGTLLGLLTIQCRRRAIDRIRSDEARKRREQGDSLTRTRTVQEPSDTGLGDRALVLDAMASLDDQHREPIELAFLSDLTHREVAEVLGEPLGTVKSRIRNGMARLRMELDAVVDARAPVTGG